MNTKAAIGIIDEYRARGAAVKITLKIVSKPNSLVAEKLNAKGDHTRASCIYYSLYKTAKNLDKKVCWGIRLVQTLINASNLGEAEKFLDGLEKSTKGEEVYMGAIWEKRGWIADCRSQYSKEVRCFRKAFGIYSRNPKALEAEGRKKDRLLTVEHFLGRALYFQGKKKDMKECVEIFTSNLASYKELKSDLAVAFNYSWLARALIAEGKQKEAREAVQNSVRYFDKVAKKQGDQIMTYSFRILAEMAISEGKKEEAAKYSLEAIRHALPSGVYYNGVLQAVKLFVRSLD